MTPISADQLIEVIYRDVFTAAVDDCELRNPPGKKPGKSAIEMRDWYVSLPESDRVRLHSVIEMTADFAVFGMLCLLDNVRPVTEGFSQELRLSVDAGGERFNFDPTDPLHAIFRARVIAESEKSER